MGSSANEGEGAQSLGGLRRSDGLMMMMTMMPMTTMMMMTMAFILSLMMTMMPIVPMTTTTALTTTMTTMALMMTTTAAMITMTVHCAAKGCVVLPKPKGAVRSQSQGGDYTVIDSYQLSLNIINRYPIIANRN